MHNTYMYMLYTYHIYILSSSYFQNIHDNPVSKFGAFRAWIFLSIHVVTCNRSPGHRWIGFLGVEGSLKNFVENCPEPKWISVWECCLQSSDPNKSIGKMVEIILKPNGQQMFWVPPLGLRHAQLWFIAEKVFVTILNAK